MALSPHCAMEWPSTRRRAREARERDDSRELIVQGYRLIYWTGEQVTMLAVVHGSRDFDRLSPKPWE